MGSALRLALIVDYESETIDLIESVASSYFRVVCRAYNAEKALNLFSELAFDLVVCNTRLSDYCGVDLLEKLRQKSPYCPIILTTDLVELPKLIRAVKLGVSDLIEKPFSSKEIVGALEKTARYRFRTLSTLNLTTRQIEVVENLLAGKSNKEISVSVGLTEQAVKYHISQLLRQFQVFTRKDLRERINREIGL